MKNNFVLILIILNASQLNNIILPINIKEGKLFYYYTTLFFGEEKTPQTFILDTTSSLISSPCDMCESCGVHSNKYFNISDPEKEVLKCNDSNCKSLYGNCENQQCSYRFDYYENAYIKGIYVNKEIRFNENSTKYFNMPIGCTINETNYIITQESDGIMGLNNDENSFINRLYRSNIISENIFSICLNHNNSGYLSLGEVVTDSHLSEYINYIPFKIDKEEKYYKIKIDSFEIGNSKIDFKSEAIIDTTATLSSFPTKLFNLIVNELDNKCSEDVCGKLVKNKNFGLCAVFKNESIMINSIINWSDINISLGESIFIWKSQNYWMDLSSENYLRACLGFESTEEDIITLGASFLHGNDVIFDRKKKNIGLVESKCIANFISTNLGSTNLTKSKSKIEFKINEKAKKLKEYANQEIKSKSKKTFFIIYLIIIVIVSSIFLTYKFVCGKRRKKRFPARKAYITIRKNQDKFKDKDEKVLLN